MKFTVHCESSIRMGVPYIAWVQREPIGALPANCRVFEATGDSEDEALDKIIGRLWSLWTEATCMRRNLGIQREPALGLQGTNQTNLPTFQSPAYCPKCTLPNATVAYCPGSTPNGACSFDREGEHLHCECTRCHYEWLEACRDAEEEKQE